MTTAVKTKPIIFSPPMAQAVFLGTKTQTRRIVNPQPKGDKDFRFVGDKQYLFSNAGQEWTRGGRAVVAKYQPGDVLYVRESWGWSSLASMPPSPNYPKMLKYRGRDGHCAGPWKPSIHMPAWAARSFLEVTAVRCERVQDISELGAIAEGCSSEKWSQADWKHPVGFCGEGRIARSNFASLWQELHGPGAWQRNYWVFVYQFRKVERP